MAAKGTRPHTTTPADWQAMQAMASTACPHPTPSPSFPHLTSPPPPTFPAAPGRPAQQAGGRHGFVHHLPDRERRSVRADLRQLGRAAAPPRVGQVGGRRRAGGRAWGLRLGVWVPAADCGGASDGVWGASGCLCRCLRAGGSGSHRRPRCPAPAAAHRCSRRRLRRRSGPYLTRVMPDHAPPTAAPAAACAGGRAPTSSAW